MIGLDGRVLYDWHNGRGGDGQVPEPLTLYLGQMSTVAAIQAGLRSAREEIALRGGTNIRAEFRNGRGEVVSSFKVT